MTGDTITFTVSDIRHGGEETFTVHKGVLVDEEAFVIGTQAY
jgi:hypothetical protein